VSIWRDHDINFNNGQLLARYFNGPAVLIISSLRNKIAPTNSLCLIINLQGRFCRGATLFLSLLCLRSMERRILLVCLLPAGFWPQSTHMCGRGNLQVFFPRLLGVNDSTAYLKYSKSWVIIKFTLLATYYNIKFL